MNDIIQVILTAIFVVGAVSWVIYKIIRPSKSCCEGSKEHCESSKSVCTGCDGCPLCEKCDERGAHKKTNRPRRQPQNDK